MECNCNDYKNIELDRKEISKRIKESKHIKKKLKLISKYESEYKLYECTVCGELWQGSHAWNWGNEEYLFKVPAIEINEWKVQPYMSPDEMLIYSAIMHDYISKNDFKISKQKCAIDSCNEKSIENSIHCKKHHIENLQETNILPNEPNGRLFPPYYFEST